jgi:hypothetical protein
MCGYVVCWGGNGNSQVCSGLRVFRRRKCYINFMQFWEERVPVTTWFLGWLLILFTSCESFLTIVTQINFLLFLSARERIAFSKYDWTRCVWKCNVFFKNLRQYLRNFYLSLSSSSKFGIFSLRNFRHWTCLRKFHSQKKKKKCVYLKFSNKSFPFRFAILYMIILSFSLHQKRVRFFRAIRAATVVKHNVFLSCG